MDHLGYSLLPDSIYRDLAETWETLYLCEKQRRKWAEQDAAYWHEIADDMSSLADKYIEREQEDPF